jgi:fructose-bisphosphate aldolase class II
VLEQYVDFEHMVHVATLSAEKESIPCGIHLSHGNMDQVKRAINAGFTSVMYDGSALPYEENIRTTREVADYGHAHGVAVEGELGALPPSDENGFAGNEIMTDPSLAKDYVARTKVDILAVAIGNAHGFYKGKPMLDFERLEQIRFALMAYDVYLTLHGGSGIPEDHIRRSISMGIKKICIYTEMCVEGKKNAIKYIDENREYRGNHDIPHLIEAINYGFAKAAAVSMDWFMSIGKANHY